MTTLEPTTSSAPAGTDSVAHVPLQHSLPALVVHQALRRELGLAGPVVHRTEEGDTRRARVLARHLGLVLDGLHHHHQIEDDLVWPPLRARVVDDTQPVIAVMEEQHAAIDRSVQTITDVVTVWSTRASAEVRDRLCDELQLLVELLEEHLELEERVVLPLAEQLLTDSEWRHIGEEADRRQPRAGRILSFGMLQHEGDPAVLASMLAAAPAPVRVLIPRLARRAYRRHATAIYGGLP